MGKCSNLPSLGSLVMSGQRFSYESAMYPISLQEKFQQRTSLKWGLIYVQVGNSRYYPGLLAFFFLG